MPVLSAQIEIKVVDAKTGAPVPFANICFEALDKSSIDYKVTGDSGRVEYNMDKAVQVAISCIGYVSQIDTLYPEKNIIVSMTPADYSVDEVVVTGQLKPVRADKSIYNVKVLGKGLIENKAATNIENLLNTELGIRVTQDASLGSGISLQGLSGEHVKILVDGVPLIGRQNGILDLGQLSIYNVDHIEIVEGPMSVIYGSNALAGAINIITKKDTRSKFSAHAGTYYETVGRYNANASFNLNRHRHTLNVSGAREFFQGFDPIENKPYWQRSMLWNPKLQYKANADYLYRAPNLKIGLSSSYFHEELRNYGDLQYRRYEVAFDDFHFTKRWVNSLDASISTGTRSRLDVLTAFSSYAKEKKTYIKNLAEMTTLLATPSLQDTTIFNSIGFRATYVFELSERFMSQAGTDLNYEYGEGKRLEGKKEIGDYAGFVNLNYNVWEQLKFQGGLRFIYNTSYEAPVVYSISTRAEPFDKFIVRASYGKGFRSPSLKELWLEFNDINHNIFGNQDLKGEYSSNLNLNFQYSLGFGNSSIEFESNFFYNRIQEKIDFVFDKTDPTRAQYINIPGGDYQTAGFQLKTTYKLHPRFTLSAGYGETGLSKLYDLQSLAWSPDATVNFNYKNLKYKFSLAGFYKYTGRVFNYRGSFFEGEGVTDIEEYYIDDFHMLDFTLSRPFFSSALNVAIGVKNLLDVENISSTGSGAIHGGGGGNSSPVAYGRTYFIQLTYSFINY